MPFELKVIAEPGNEAQCGSCSGMASAADESVICVFFGHRELEWTWPITPPCESVADHLEGCGGGDVCSKCKHPCP